MTFLRGKNLKSYWRAKATAKSTKHNENTLKIIVNFKTLSQVSRWVLNKKSFEITYTKANCINNTPHFTMYEKT